MSLIPADADAALWAAMLALMGVGFWAERRTRIGARLTGIVVTMTLAMILANLRVLPTGSAVYDTVFAQFLPVAIPLMLFRADLRRIVPEAGPTLAVFVIGAIGVVAGVFLAVAIVPVGDRVAEIAGLYTATYIGGSANFGAVAIAADVEEGTTLTSVIAADIVGGEIQMIFLILLPALAWTQRHFVHRHGSGVHVLAADETEAGDHPPAGEDGDHPFLLREIDLAGVCLALACAAALVALGDWTAAMIGDRSYAILFTSAYALVIANGFPRLVARMSGDYGVALLLIFLFLTAIAAQADVWALAETGPVFFYFVAIVLAVHTALVLIAGWLLRIDIADIVIASTASVGGATSASAIASAKGWRSLIAPGILLGTLGNAGGTFIGVSIWKLLS